MKQLVKGSNLKFWLTLLIFNFVHIVLLAQDSGSGGGTTSQETSSSSTKISITEDSNWYASPWVWVIGAAVFILLLVALTRGGGRDRTDAGRSDKVTVTKTVRRDTDTDTTV